MALGSAPRGLPLLHHTWNVDSLIRVRLPGPRGKLDCVCDYSVFLWGGTLKPWKYPFTPQIELINSKYDYDN